MRGEDSAESPPDPRLKSEIDGFEGSVAEFEETDFETSFCFTREALRGMAGLRKTGPESTSCDDGPKQWKIIFRTGNLTFLTPFLGSTFVQFILLFQTTSFISLRKHLEICEHSSFFNYGTKICLRRL